MDHHHATTGEPLSINHSCDAGLRCLPDAVVALRQADVSLVRFEYSGQAGVRRIKPTRYHDQSGRIMDARMPKAVRQDIDVFLHELLELRFPEWADAQGSRGELEWDVIADDLEHRHSLRQITYETVTVRGLDLSTT